MLSMSMLLKPISIYSLVLFYSLWLDLQQHQQVSMMVIGYPLEAMSTNTFNENLDHVSKDLRSNDTFDDFRKTPSKHQLILQIHTKPTFNSFGENSRILNSPEETSEVNESKCQNWIGETWPRVFFIFYSRSTLKNEGAHLEDIYSFPV